MFFTTISSCCAKNSHFITSFIEFFFVDTKQFRLLVLGMNGRNATKKKKRRQGREHAETRRNETKRVQWKKPKKRKITKTSSVDRVGQSIEYSSLIGRADTAPTTALATRAITPKPVNSAAAAKKNEPKEKAAKKIKEKLKSRTWNVTPKKKQRNYNKNNRREQLGTIKEKHQPFSFCGGANIFFFLLFQVLAPLQIDGGAERTRLPHDSDFFFLFFNIVDFIGLDSIWFYGLPFFVGLGTIKREENSEKRSAP